MNDYAEKFIEHQFTAFKVKRLKKKYKDNLNLIKQNKTTFDFFLVLHT